MLYDVDDMRYAIGVKKSAAKHSSKAVEIVYVTKADGSNPDHFIAHVGGIRQDGKPWKLTEEEVIRSIEHNVEFYIIVNRKRVRVIVASNHQRKYIKTVLDRDTPTTLLSLPECPA